MWAFKAQHTLRIFNMLFCVGFIILVSSCANVGTPSGGPKDVTPPVPVKSTPLPNQLGFRGKNITIEFNENILLDKPMEKVYISPPMNIPPIVKAYGKKLYIEIDDKEEYQDSTTYTIDFGNSILDNNEKNPMGEYSFAFSTDSVIDSLRISGYVIYADNLDPAKGVYVGIYKNKADSAFRKTVPVRIGKTNEEGYFCILNVTPGTYRIVALKDENRNYKFDQKSELVGFSEEDITPSIAQVMMPDTTWIDSLTVDTIVDKLVDVYSPFDILLPIFQETDSDFYYIKSERKLREKLSVYFTGTPNRKIEMEPLNFKPKGSWYLLETSANKDTLNYWITDSLIYNKDSLEIAFHNWKVDSNQVLQPYIDTLYLNFAKPKEHKRSKTEEHKQVLLKLSTNASGSFNQFDTITVTSPSPIAELKASSICLVQKKDSTEIDMPITLKKRNDFTYEVYAKLKYGDKYFLRLDSAAMYDIYGLTNKDLESNFTVRTLESYANVDIVVTNAPANFRVQLMSPSDVVVKEAPAEAGTAKFKFLEPGTYYIRGYSDTNKNKVWDTGNYGLKKQAEEVYYYNKKFTLKSNWDISEAWNVNEFHVLEQKPLEIKLKQQRDKDKDSQ